MTIELKILVLTAVWSLIINYIPAIARGYYGGRAWGISNRDNPPEVPRWVQRAQRAHLNMWENFGVFIVLVVVAHLAGISNDWTVRGAYWFFVGRIAHTAFYLLGIPFPRTVSYLVSTAGAVMILTQLF